MKRIILSIILAMMFIPRLDAQSAKPRVAGKWELHYIHLVSEKDKPSETNIQFTFRQLGAVPDDQIEGMIVEFATDDKLKIGTKEVLSYTLSDDKIMVTDPKSATSVSMDYEFQDDIFLTLSRADAETFYQFMIAGANDEEAKKIDLHMGIAYYKWGNTLRIEGGKTRQKSFFDEAIEKFERSTQLYKDDTRAYTAWAGALVGLAKATGDTTYLDRALAKLEEAETLDPEDGELYRYWGDLLFNIANIEGDKAIYDEAFAKYEKAEQLRDEDAQVYMDYGRALLQLAIDNDDENLYKKAIGKFEKATRWDPANFYAYLLWGKSLTLLAGQSGDPELYREAFAKYDKAAWYHSDFELTYLEWGNALMELAEIKKDEALYTEAIEKFDKGVEGESVYPDFYVKKGKALMARAKLRGSVKADKEEIEKAQTKGCYISEAIGDKVTSAYSALDLARLYALAGDKEEAFVWLERAMKPIIFSTSSIDIDPDLASLRSDPRFNELLLKYEPPVLKVLD